MPQLNLTHFCSLNLFVLLRFLADRCNATIAMQRSAIVMRYDVVCLSSVICNTRVLWPNRFMDQDATWYADRPGPM